MSLLSNRCLRSYGRTNRTEELDMFSTPSSHQTDFNPEMQSNFTYYTQYRRAARHERYDDASLIDRSERATVGDDGR